MGHAMRLMPSRQCLLSRHQTLTQAYRVKARLIQLANFFNNPLSLFEIGLYFILVLQVVGNDQIHICQVQGWVLRGDLFSSCAILKGVNNGIQRYARLADADNTILTNCEWHCHCRHVKILRRKTSPRKCGSAQLWSDNLCVLGVSRVSCVSPPSGALPECWFKAKETYKPAAPHSRLARKNRVRCQFRTDSTDEWS